MKVSERAKQRLIEFSARVSDCPICGRKFRHDCDHTITQAKERLYENYIRAVMKNRG